MQPRPLKPIEALRRSVWMVFQAAPRELRNLSGLNLITGTGPSISLFLSKVVIDEASRLLGRGVTENAIALILSEPKLLWSLGASVLLNLFVDSIDSIGATLFASLRDRVRGHVQGQVFQKVANFDDIALFETPDLLNLLELTDKGMQRLQQLSFIVAATLMGVFMFIPSVLLSVSISWWVPPVLLLSSIPSIFVEIKHHKKSWRVEETQASVNREMNIYGKVLTGEAYAKELRLFSLQSILLERWQGLFHRMFNTMEQVRREGAVAVMLWSLLGGLGATLPYVYVVIGVLQGNYTLGDLALYTGIIMQMRRSLYILIGHTGDIYDVALATSPIFQLLDLEPQLQSGRERKDEGGGMRDERRDEGGGMRDETFISHPPSFIPHPFSFQGIQFQDVSFTYPGGDKPILEQLNLTIQPGEMVALVGENGAGKTTLAKLLCRLYDPTQGSIYWGEQDLRSMDLDDLRSRIAVVMQDYARFPATLRENVGWGYLPKLQEDGAIQSVLQDAGISQVVAELSHGLETPLGKQLENGVDLSGGQWQRVAIARALMRLSETELLVFDEPTAALDPKNEHEIYRIFKTIAQGRMAVVVSHRLALAKMADRIIVLEHGKIVEAGTHEELLEKGGGYHTMFTRQASSYL
ncbi:ABC transporter ATP-binding protein/permease [Kovacikia minuta CCNUW1]|uniref:ABC transporter ATP-binding protein n=1 Tax=Kovacikia minuta TaxID=2931930 RepID=UPI001CCB90D2|nr:ABC transporter ATP-binding protein [Kovacikia minuta]UBF23602.1 ABC transporter ATP-binding protein/permease [Kovacikia minuta CCNUW1]